MKSKRIKETELDQEMIDKIKSLSEISDPHLNNVTRQKIFAAASEKCRNQDTGNVILFRLAAVAALIMVFITIFTVDYEKKQDKPASVVQLPVKSVDEALEWESAISARQLSSRLAVIGRGHKRQRFNSGLKQRQWRRKLYRRKRKI